MPLRKGQDNFTSISANLKHASRDKSDLRIIEASGRRFQKLAEGSFLVVNQGMIWALLA